MRMSCACALAAVFTASATFTGCLEGQRGTRVKFDQLAAVQADAVPQARVDAAKKAMTVNFADITKIVEGKISLNDNGQDLILDPVGEPLHVAGQNVWWLDDLKPLIAEGSRADTALAAHLAARAKALEGDGLYNVGVVYTGTGVALSAVGLAWLVLGNGGDPAFYTTLAASTATAGGGVGIFMTWYLQQIEPSLEARKQKYQLMQAWNDGVAERYGVRVEKGAAPHTVQITAASP